MTVGHNKRTTVRLGLERRSLGAAVSLNRDGLFITGQQISSQKTRPINWPFGHVFGLGFGLEIFTVQPPSNKTQPYGGVFLIQFLFQ